MSTPNQPQTTPSVPLILAPAGNRASFLAALAAGADAVYCGLKSYSARAEAKNFTIPELAALTELAHGKGMRVHTAFNAMLTTGDIERASGLMQDLVRTVRPDALIIQDLAMIELARQAGFTGEIHLSTLANAGIAKSLGWIRRHLAVDQVVVPRELDIDEIRAMAAACPEGLGRGGPRPPGRGDRGRAVLQRVGALLLEQFPVRQERTAGTLCAALPPAVPAAQSTAAPFFLHGSQP